MSPAEYIKQKALDLGFDLVGITDTAPLDNKHFKILTDWLALGCAGRMDYMKKNLDKRTNPAKLLENARSVICVALNYNPPMPSSSLRASQSDARQSHPQQQAEPMGTVANYARYEDYHSFIKRQLQELVSFVSSAVEDDFKFKICVDSAPLAERALATRAGLGFIGKNHILINPVLGPQLLLGEIITTLKLPVDRPIADSCSNCNNCIKACPTGALTADGRFDANKCISYLTIEYKGRIPDDLAEKIGDRLFGCDQCVLVCPFHKNAPVCKNKQFKFYPDRAKLNLHQILALTKESFETKFTDSPLKRLTLDCLKRNARVCLANAAQQVAAQPAD